MKATTTMLISKIEQQLNGLNKISAGTIDTVAIPVRDLETLLKTIRELEQEVKKHKHGKPKFDAIGSPRYYSPE